MKYLFIAFLFISSFAYGQGIEPSSFQPTPYLGGVLRGVTPFVDEFTGQTYYLYVHDSLDAETPYVDTIFMTDFNLYYIKNGDTIFVGNVIDSSFIYNVVSDTFALDMDIDSTNELQELYHEDNILVLTGAGPDSQVDLTPYMDVDSIYMEDYNLWYTKSGESGTPRFVGNVTDSSYILNVVSDSSTVVENDYGTIIVESPVNTYGITVDSSKYTSVYQNSLKQNAITGTTGQTLRFSGTNTLAANSLLYNDGTYIGINNTSPSYPFHVLGGGLLSTSTFGHTGVNGGINVHNTGTLASGRDAQIRLVNGTSYFGANDRTYQLFNVGESSTAAAFAIQYYNGSSYFERLRLTSAGYLGLATASPSQILDVNGGTRFRGGVYDGSNVIGSSGQVLTSTGSATAWATAPTGSGTTNYLPLWTSSTALGNSKIYQSGAHIIGDLGASFGIFGARGTNYPSLNCTHPTWPLVNNVSQSQLTLTNGSSYVGASDNTVQIANAYRGSSQSEFFYQIWTGSVYRTIYQYFFADNYTNFPGEVRFANTTGTAATGAGFDSNGKLVSTTLASGTVTGSGTDNYIPRFNGTTAIENSIMYDDGTNIGIGTASPTAKLSVAGALKVTGSTSGNTRIWGYDHTDGSMGIITIGSGLSLSGDALSASSAYDYWRISAAGGTAYAVTDDALIDFANGTGITWSRSGGVMTATNTGVTSLTGTTGVGVSASTGAVTLSLNNDLLALEGLASTGIAARTASNTWAQRTITSGTGISIVNGNGVSGNPTITNNGVVSLAGTAPITVSSATGAITVGLNFGSGLALSGSQLQTTPVIMAFLNHSSGGYTANFTAGETKKVDFTTALSNSSITTDVSTNENITINSAGTYEINYNVCISSPTNFDEPTLSLYINGSQNATTVKSIWLTVAGQKQCISGTHVMALSSTNTVDMRVSHPQAQTGAGIIAPQLKVQKLF